MVINTILQVIAQFLAVVLVLCLHEFAHAFVAYKCGDSTAKLAGRMTLNPVKHFDLLGLLAFTFIGFGWANPVPINPNNFKKYKLGVFLTSIAGIVANLLLAFISYPLILLFLQYVYPAISGKYLGAFLWDLLSCIYLLSLNFAAFNLLPLYPLDGFRVVTAFNKKRGSLYRFLRNNGQYILLGLLAIHFLSSYISILGYVDLLGYAMYWIKFAFDYPITSFWHMIFNI